MSKWLCVILFLHSSFAYSHSQKNVIFILLDGVRWQEFFNGVDGKLDPSHSGEKIFTLLGNSRYSKSWVLGPESECQTISVSNWVTMSLPGYQSIFGGRTPWCFSNDCWRMNAPTLFEGLVRKGYAKKDVALFASWEKLEVAAISSEGLKQKLSNWTHNVGFESFDHPEHKTLNAEQKKDLPEWGESRKDKYTFEHAKLYLKREKPRLLTIQLVESDEWGHVGKYDKYVQTLKQYDAWMSELVQTLDQMGEYGKNTTIIVTTDHGRGEDTETWSEHGYQHGGRKVWLWTLGYEPQLDACLLPWTHNRIRGLIESELKK